MEEIENVELTYLKLEDYDDFKEAMITSYTNMPDSYWKEHQIKNLINLFPEGQAVIKINNKIAGVALSIIVDYNSFDEKHTYQDLTGDFSFSTHSMDGDVLYGIDVFITPEFRGLRLGRRLYDYRKELCERLNLRGIAFGGRIPNYHKYSDKLSPKEYINKVKVKEIHDPVLNFQISNDFHPTKILKGYLKGDESSEEFAVLMEWDNIYYQKPNKKVSAKKEVVRLGLVQWQMRPYRNLDELMQQVEFFVESLSGYRSDFALFPEFFNAPLLAENNQLAESAAIRELAKYTQPIVDKMAQLAISYNINIISGSMPEVVDGHLYNAGYLLRRDGTSERYEKLHITPNEVKVWGLQGGNKLKSFDTDCGKIGVLICYDSEFPELGRMLADDGMNILFVPFLTDTQNGYSRVRNCCQSRAIENECYVAIAGSIGNLPKVNNMDIQYAQSAVFTPCDFAFPANGIKAEATPNTEMMLIVDVDLNILMELNQFGSVRNLKDRRKDLYELKRF
jgi:predicted amidohydrolase/GNAT superfamily N-acetyltransferase